MVNVNEVYARYLTADSFDEDGAVYTIRRVTFEDMPDGNRKLVVYFEEAEKGLVLNKTNGRAIEAIAKTPETDDWTGVKVRLFKDRCNFMGRMVDCIRVRKP